MLFYSKPSRDAKKGYISYYHERLHSPSDCITLTIHSVHRTDPINFLLHLRATDPSPTEGRFDPPPDSHRSVRELTYESNPIMESNSEPSESTNSLTECGYQVHDQTKFPIEGQNVEADTLNTDTVHNDLDQDSQSRTKSTPFSATAIQPFRYLDLPEELQENIVNKLYCAKPWQLRIFKIGQAPTRIQMIKPITRCSALSRMPEFIDLVDQVTKTSRNGKLSFGLSGCTWDLREDVETLDGFKTISQGITTILFEKRVGDRLHTSQLQLAFPNLCKIVIGNNKAMRNRIQAIFSEKPRWTFDDALLGVHDEEMCRMAGEGLKVLFEGEEFDVKEILPAKGELCVSIGLHFDTIQSLNPEAFSIIADLMIFDIIIQEQIRVARKRFINTHSMRKLVEPAVKHRVNGKWDDMEEWNGEGEVDVYGRYIFYHDVQREIIMADRKHRNLEPLRD